MSISTTTATNRAIMLADQARQAALESEVAAILDATTTPDHSKIAGLAHRDRVASAIRALVAVLPRPRANNHTADSVVPCLLDRKLRDEMLIFRLGMKLGLPLPREGKVPPRDIERAVRRIDSQMARVALALAGKPRAPWCSLTRPERAGVVLHRLCRGDG